MKKIAIVSNMGIVCEDFDSCRGVKIFDTEGSKILSTINYVFNSPLGIDKLCKLLKDKHADVLLCKCPSEDERERLEEVDIQCMFNIEGKVDDALEMFLNQIEK